MSVLADARVTFSPVSAAEVAELERALGALLPPKYLAFIKQRGVCFTQNTRGDRVVRMLRPAEVLELFAWSQEFVDEFSFGEREVDRQAALRELEVRKRLIPFQYVALEYVSDFHCFETGHRRGDDVLIIDAFHDDFELAPWLLNDAPNLSHCTFDFEEHLERVLRKALDEV